MTEERVRRELAEAVADEPPLWLDIDDIVACGRRRARRRRTLAGAAALTGTVAALATALSLLLAPATPTTTPADQAATPSPPPRPTASPRLWPGPMDRPPADTSAEYEVVEDVLLARVEAAARDLPETARVVVAGNREQFMAGSPVQTWRFVAWDAAPGPLTLTVTITTSEERFWLPVGKPMSCRYSLGVPDGEPRIECGVGGHRKIVVSSRNGEGETLLNERQLEAFCRALVF